MPSRISNAVLVVLLGLAGAATGGCGSRQSLSTRPSGGAGATASAGSAGATASAGSAGATASAGAAGGGAGSGDSAGAAGAAGMGAAGSSGAAGTSDLAGSNGLGGTVGVAGAAGAVGVGGASGAAVLGPLGGDVTQIVATPGCGRPAGQPLGMFVRDTIETMGNKPGTCADSTCGPWSYSREYFLRLPTNYDDSKAYPIVFEGPGCGGKGNNLFSVPGFASAAIRVGLSPSVDAQASQATNPGQGCFDDKEGDDSVDWVFYEKLYDKLAAELCFDRNRVFAAGNNDGALMANELGCKYAGDALRPVRGVMSSGAGLPDPKYQPTCTSKPMAGVWVADLNNPSYPFSETTSALTRAMHVNGCTVGSSFDSAELDPFQLGAANSSTACKTVKGCRASFPLVICPLPGYGHSSDEYVADPAWAAFLDLFAPTP